MVPPPQTERCSRHAIAVEDMAHLFDRLCGQVGKCLPIVELQPGKAMFCGKASVRFDVGQVIGGDKGKFHDRLILLELIRKLVVGPRGYSSKLGWAQKFSD